MISFDSSYLRSVSPAPCNDGDNEILDDRKEDFNASLPLTNVNISVDVLSILDISEVKISRNLCM